MSGKHKKSHADRPHKHPAPKPETDYANPDDVLEASLESFPASDPPAWISHPHPKPEDEKK